MERYGWQQFENDLQKIAAEIKKTGLEFQGVFSPTSGGSILAVCLSCRLGLPLLREIKRPGRVLVVDTVAENGGLICAYLDNFTVALFCRDKCLFKPDLWLHEMKEDIRFPWEQ